MTGVINRAKSVKSGRLEYHFESGIIGADALPPNRSPGKLLLFLGSDWIERIPDEGSALVNYGGTSLRIDEAHQPDNSVRQTATILPPSSFKDPSQQNRRPWFAGSFWHVRQSDFVDRHRADFRLAAPRNIDGIPCEVCEIDVQADDARSAFRVHSPLLASGGILRVHIAPQLGFVLPLVELRSATDVTILTYESKDWLEFPEGIYFPRRTRMELRAPAGETVYEQFTISPERINQPIEKSEFIVKVPAGTAVRDERDAENVHRYDLAKDSTSAVITGVDPDPQNSATGTTAPSTAGKSWLLGGALVAAVTCLALAIWRLRLRRGVKDR